MVNRDRPATEARIPLSWASKSVWSSVVLVAWVGVALSISTTPSSRPAPSPKPRSLAQQRADQAAFDAETTADRVGHPVAAAELRRTERKLEARLRKQNDRAAVNAQCRRTYRWDISCEVELTDENGLSERSSVQGQYLPQARMVLFDTPLPGAQP